ncbi:MAG: hypothetical protein JW862_05765 [Anaerolineales bacterium]|nr:hypothetical protein [Anaerolineales bacterium]
MSLHRQTAPHKFLAQIYLVLVVLLSLIATGAIVGVPSEPGSQLLFGLSGARLLMVAALMSVTALCGYVLVYAWRSPQAFDRWANTGQGALQNKWLWWGSILLATTIPTATLITLILESFTVHAVPLAYIDRLRPVLIWASSVSSLSLLFLPQFRYAPYELPVARTAKQVFLPASIVLGVCLFAWLWIAQTGMGLSNRDTGAGWNAPGAPVLVLQVAAIWIGSLVFLALYLVAARTPLFLKIATRSYRFDFLLALLIWLASFLLWNSQEVKPNWFAAIPQAPNFEYYPNSDASLYDSAALNALTGNGYLQKGSPFVYRPFYALVLFGLHHIAGPGYESIIPLQVGILALIPVCLYLLVVSLHQRVSGLLVAAIFIWRQVNALGLGDTITYSHVKLLMSDLPTLLGIVLYLWLFSQWLEDPARRRYHPLVIGGVAGLSILIRPEFGVLLPFTAALAWLALRKHFKTWFHGMLGVFVGLLLLVSPWIWRNYQLTGTLFLDSPFYRADLFAKRYAEEQPLPSLPTPAPSMASITPEVSSTPALNQETSIQATPTPGIALLPGESLEDFTERMTGEAVEFARQDPSSVLEFISNHFFSSWLQSVLYLPTRLCVTGIDFSQFLYTPGEKFWRSCAIPDNYVRYQPFWLAWSERIAPVTQVYIFFHLVMISIGVGTAWRQRRFAGLLPLVAALGYYSIHAFARNSGGRYIQPVDWFSSLYWGIGLTQVSLWGLRYLRGKPFPGLRPAAKQLPALAMDQKTMRRNNLGLAVVLLVVGLLLPLSDLAFPSAYSDQSKHERFQELVTSLHLAGYSNAGVEALDTSLMFQGRALYPRTHPAGTGESGSTWPAFYAREFDRISFILAGPQNFGVVLPVSVQAVDLPHYADVFLLGCPGPEYLEAWALAVYEPDGSLMELVVTDNWPGDFSCPASSP